MRCKPWWILCTPLLACGDGAGGKPPSAPDAGARAVEALAEAEPNDESGKAQALGAPAVVTGTVGGKDVDWFVVTPPPGTEALRIEASGPGDLALELYDADRNRTLRAAAAPAGATETIEPYRADAKLYVKVSAEGEPQSFRLSIEPRPRAAGGELEPDDRRVDAVPLVAGANVTGSVSFEEDVDFVRLEVPPPATPEERRLVRLAFTSPPELRATLQLLDAEEAPLGEWKAKETGAPIAIRNVTLKPDARLPLYLAVRSSWIGKGRRTAAPDRAWKLQASVEPAPADLEEEPNDTPAQASVVPADALGRLGFLAPAGDEDHLALTLERAQVARLQLSGVDRVDLELALVDPEKADAPELVRVNEGGVREGEVLPNLWLPAGRSVLRIRGAARKLDGKWVRDLENAEQTWALQLQLRDATDGDEREPNDLAASASRIAPGTTGVGMIHPRRDVDLWSFTVPDGPKRPLTATLTGLTKVDVALYLRGGAPDGKGLPPVIAASDKAKETAPEKLVAEVEGGTYFLEVRDVRDASGLSNAVDSYRLSIALGE